MKKLATSQSSGYDSYDPDGIHVAALEPNVSWIVSYPKAADHAIDVRPGRHHGLLSSFLPANGWIASVDCRVRPGGGAFVDIQVQKWVTRNGAMADSGYYERFVQELAGAAALTLG